MATPATAAAENKPPPLAASKEFVSCLSNFFQRDLISIPLIKKYPHSQFQQRCQIRAATLELDHSAHPNIEYIAGDRLSVYPVNQADHVHIIMKHLVDDIYSPQQQQQKDHSPKRPRLNMSQPWQKFVQLYGKDSLRLALMHVYDITMAPSRDLLRIMAECCTNREQKQRLLQICKTDDSWEKWICQQLRTLKSTLEEFSSCSSMSAKSLISELTLQQPRQYTISSIKSSKRFRTELIVFQHKFSLRQVANALADLKGREEIDTKRRQQSDTGGGGGGGGGQKSPSSPTPSGAYGPMKSSPLTLHVNHNPDQDKTSSRQSSFSIRSLRSVGTFGTSPISTQQVKRVPSYSGPLMSLYATSTMNSSLSGGGGGGGSGSKSERGNSNSAATKSTIGAGAKSIIPDQQKLVLPSEQMNANNKSTSNETKQQFDGLCSNYLLNLAPNDHVVCEFVENPRFTLKGNRERPIMMIGQDVGIVAFKPFWQQRALEHDRAQIFYTLFKDLSPKKFGDMQLVCVTGGSRCKVEDLFKRDIQIALTNKILSGVSHLSKSNLVSLLDHAALSSGTSLQAAAAVAAKHLPIESRELLELGTRIAKLLVENNGCIYTCCDAQMTQAIEILIVESLARNTQLSRSKIMSLIPKWKGRKTTDQQQPVANQKFLYTLENPFEGAQIVQEIYESSI